MKRWPAKQIQSAIAANNAVKIRSALAVSINARKIAREYKKTDPTVSDNPTADRVRARAWATVNVDQDLNPLKRMIQQAQVEGWVTGKKAADHSIKQAAMRLKTVSIIDIVLDPNADVWKDWKPGDEVSAELLERSYGLDLLLQQAGVTIKEVQKTSIDRIGSKLADGIRSGLSVDKIAESIQDEVASPSRALTIAMTETTRATMLAAVDRYREASIDLIQWTAMDPCPECAKNDGQIVKIGEAFATGDLEPPAHPNCLCGLLPVLDKSVYSESDDQARAIADDVFEESKDREETYTEDLVEIQRQLADQGMEPSFSGLRFRLKQKKSLTRKIKDEVAKGEYPSLREAAKNLSDAVRYTYVWEDDNYVAGIKATLDELGVRGFKLRVKNYWMRDDYKGVNVAVTDPMGKLFELQFHTQSSVDVKEELHALYEKYRVEKDDAKRYDYWQGMVKKAKDISEPGDFEELIRIGTLKYEYFTDSRGVRRTGNPDVWHYMGYRD